MILQAIVGSNSTPVHMGSSLYNSVNWAKNVYLGEVEVDEFICVWLGGSERSVAGQWSPALPTNSLISQLWLSSSDNHTSQSARGRPTISLDKQTGNHTVRSQTDGQWRCEITRGGAHIWGITRVSHSSLRTETQATEPESLETCTSGQVNAQISLESNKG